MYASCVHMKPVVKYGQLNIRPNNFVFRLVYSKEMLYRQFSSFLLKNSVFFQTLR